MLLLSIHPKYVEKIIRGEKQVELRRQRPRSQPGDWLAVYATLPVQQLVGVARIEQILVASPSQLWNQTAGRAGVTHDEFRAYFREAEMATGIVLAEPLRLPAPVSLARLRTAWPGFRPPQSFLYLTDEQVELVVNQFDAQVRQKLLKSVV